MFYLRFQGKKNRLVDFSTRRLTHTHAYLFFRNCADIFSIQVSLFFNQNGII